MAISSGVAPHYAWLVVNGAKFPCLTGSATQNGTRRSSEFSATIPLNYPGAASALAHLGDNQSGVDVQSVAGNGTLVMGEIDTVTFNYGQNGTIHVTGRDDSNKLYTKKINEKFLNMKTTDVVKKVCQEVGLGCVITGGEGTNAGKELDQEYAKIADGETPAAIIAKCAEQDNARWWVDTSSTLHYDINPQGGGGYSVHYRAGPPEVADFFVLSIKRNVQAGKEINVQIDSWHTKDKKVNSGQGTDPGNGGPLEYKYAIPGLKEEDAQALAQNKADEIGRQEITVTAKVVGDPKITVDSGLSVSGTDFDGSYIIDSVHHTFGMSGYTMTITARNSLEGAGGASPS